MWRAASATSKLRNLFLKSEAAFPFETVVAQMNEAMKELEAAWQPLYPQQKVPLLTEKIQIQTTIGIIRVKFQMDFDNTFMTLQSPTLYLCVFLCFEWWGSTMISLLQITCILNVMKMKDYSSYLTGSWNIARMHPPSSLLKDTQWCHQEQKSQRRQHKEWNYFVVGKTEILWVQLNQWKDPSPLDLSECAIANRIQDNPAFKWWVNDTIKPCNQIIGKAKVNIG